MRVRSALRLELLRPLNQLSVWTRLDSLAAWEKLIAALLKAREQLRHLLILGGERSNGPTNGSKGDLGRLQKANQRWQAHSRRRRR